MNLNDLVGMQVVMDESHGFPVNFKDNADKYRQLTKDLVGLFGEVGEFSNIVKKININIDRPKDYPVDLGEAEDNLKMELIDSLIYIIRIGAILKIDLEAELLKTIKKNEVRYEKLRSS